MNNKHRAAPRNQPSGESLAPSLGLWEAMDRDDSSSKTKTGQEKLGNETSSKARGSNFPDPGEKSGIS